MTTPFETGNVHSAEVLLVDKKGIEINIPIAQKHGEDAHIWESTIKVYLAKREAVAAGLPEKIFQLDDIHYKEFSGKRLDELLKLVEHQPKTVLTFDIKF